jgi:trigger factor
MKEGPMKVQVEEVSSIEKRLQIEVDPSFIEQELAKAYAALSHEVRVPGFRPGKVPRRILEQRYRSEVEADVVKKVQSRAFIAAVQEHNVPAVGNPSITGGKLVPQQSLTFTARVEVKPAITAKDYRGLGLKKIDGTVSDEKVAEQIERIRGSRATFELITDRKGAQKGDLATIDFDATVDGQPFSGGEGRDVSVEIVEGVLTQGNVPELEGVAVGEVKNVESTFPADYSVEEVRGKVASFRITLKELKFRKMPEFDDEFAKSLGAESAESMKARIKTDMQRAALARARADERDDVFKKLIEKNTFEVPKSLIERGIDMMLENAMSSMMRSGVDPRTLRLDWSKLRAEFRPRSETEVRGQLILESIATQEGLSPKPEDVETKLKELAEETGTPLNTVRNRLSDDESMASLKARIAEDQAIAFVKSHATFEA